MAKPSRYKPVAAHVIAARILPDRLPGDQYRERREAALARLDRETLRELLHATAALARRGEEVPRD